MPNSPINVFVIYSREDIEHLQRIKKHLSATGKRNNLIIRSDGEILPGEPWDAKISEFLKAADIIVLLISSDFFDSEYVNEIELPKAIQRQEAGKCILIPVIVRPCAWQDSLPKIHALPRDAKPISSWDDKDEAYLDVVNGIEKVALNIRKESLIDESVQSDEFFFYKAFTYTYRRHETRDFDFSIVVSKGKISATVKGLHFDETTGEDTGEEYFGSAEIVGKRLFFNLNIRYPENNLARNEPKRLHVILQFGDRNLRNHAMVIGAAQWISSYDYPVSAEILLFKIQNEKGYVPEMDLLKIKRYMMFKRSMRRVPERIVDTPDDLKIKGNVLHQLSDIVGVYRVWTYFKEGIVQSRFTIMSNFNAIYETKTYGKESGDIQVCLLNISNHGRQRICISHHPEKGTEILAYSIIDIPLEEQVLTKGVFCSMGRQAAEYQHCGWMVLKREAWESDFDVAVYSPEKLQNLLLAHPSLKDMLRFFNQYSDVKVKTRKSK